MPHRTNVTDNKTTLSNKERGLREGEIDGSHAEEQVPQLLYRLPRPLTRPGFFAPLSLLLLA